MTPDDHAARARDLLRAADEILARAIEENTGRPSENPMVHQQVQTLALLAQAHATLSLRRPDRPAGSAEPDRGGIVRSPTRQPAQEPLNLQRWERLSETDFTDFDLPDDGDAGLPGLEHKDYYRSREDLPPDAYDDDDDDLPD